MKIFIHEGSGHYIGSVVIVTAEKKSDASGIIRKYLDDNGLFNEPLSISEMEISDSNIVYAQNGDY